MLGSLHPELVALLEDRDAPLYNRATDHVELGHLDIASILTILREHADFSPARLLFLWNLFEGVPKFYRDCFEQGVLEAPRRELLEGMFFRSSSPLRSEADNWFLSELRGRYDVVLKYVARHPGCSHADLVAHVRSVSSESPEQVGGYLKILIEKYQMIEKRLPVFARPTAKKGRYYLRDNFLRSWLDCLASPVSAINFRPMDQLVRQADERLIDAEGFGFERLVGVLYEERSRKGLGDFSLTSRIQGYWERPDVEIDLVAIDEDNRRIRLGTCKRSAEKLRANLGTHRGHVERFLAAHSRFADWTTELAALTPELDAEARAAIQSQGFIAQDLRDLIAGL